MTAVKVVDASAIAAILFDELTRDTVAARLRTASLHAPALIEFEIANVCLKKIKARPAERLALITAMDALGMLNISLHRVDLVATVSLAETTSLTPYDASYLWLAKHLGVELVTLDGKLERAMARLP